MWSDLGSSWCTRSLLLVVARVVTVHVKVTFYRKPQVLYMHMSHTESVTRTDAFSSLLQLRVLIQSALFGSATKCYTCFLKSSTQMALM